MWKIAKDHGLKLESLIVMNPQIENPSLIFVGQKINVKVKEQKKQTEHVVVKGDTVSSIAKKYGLTVSQLEELNPQLIPVGQKVRISK